MTAKSHDIFGIQLLRGAAAIAVVIHHALEVSNGSQGRFSPDWLTTSGAVGVDIFFVISGFVMTYTAVAQGRPPMRPLAFLWKRVRRIYPFYWVCLLAISLLFAMGFMKSHDISPTKFLLSALLIPGDPMIHVSWTLSYGLFFYLIFAAALLSASREMTALIAILAILFSIGAGELLKIPFFADPITIEFCFGVLLAIIAMRLPKGGLCLHSVRWHGQSRYSRRSGYPISQQGGWMDGPALRRGAYYPC